MHFLFLPSPRAVVDGDIVSGVPSAGYKHIGTNVIVDSKGEGSIIIDPSFVEKYLRMSSKTSIGSHSLNVYRRGLKGVKLATLYLNGQLDETQKRNIFHLEEEEGKLHTDGIPLPTRRSKRSSTSPAARASSLDASVMKIAQESCAYVASCLNDEDDKDAKEASRKDEEDDPELKLRQQDITNVDQWAVDMQHLTVFEKFLIWIGFGETNDEQANGKEAPCVDIAPDKQILEIACSTLHQDPKTESGEKE